jgi:hypothetical protein
LIKGKTDSKTIIVTLHNTGTSLFVLLFIHVLLLFTKILTDPKTKLMNPGIRNNGNTKPIKRPVMDLETKPFL